MARQLRLELRGPSSAGREDFIVSPTNADAVRALDAWPSWYGGCLVLIGPSGSGKSHLARTWAMRVGAEIFTAGKGCDFTAPGALQGRPILVEDAHFGAPDEALFHLINMAGDPGGGLLMTAQAAPRTWPANLPDLRSRLNALPVAELPPPDDAVLEGLLRNFFRERSITPSDDLIPYLLKRIERSALSAREIVERLDEAAYADQKPVTRALARHFFENEGETFDIGE
ncbi:MAG TPA: chromosomal replication initiator DnaA [Caulobacteraceae bacterium]|nr:chromosomal replication initiator DnaA [Caulobacteraceae bacterium]